MNKWFLLLALVLGCGPGGPIQYGKVVECKYIPPHVQKDQVIVDGFVHEIETNIPGKHVLIVEATGPGGATVRDTYESEPGCKGYKTGDTWNRLDYMRK